MIKVENLNFKYGDREILKEINLIFNTREFVAIIGPNGSGKTTLLKNISNVIVPDSGYIYLEKKLLNNYSPKELAKKMAVVPQDTSVDYNFSVYDLVMMGRNPYQDRWGRVNSKDREIVREVMELTDTLKFKSKKINELSGGERQRVIIARALAQKPEVLLLDEPTSSLDINYQGEIFDLLKLLNRELNLSIILVSHDLNLTSQYCDRLILLKEGSIYKIGTPEEVLTENNIKNVYQAEVTIKRNPLTARPYIIINPARKERRKREADKKIHVVCGGGSGEFLLEELYNLGFNISCGVINQGDNDWVVAKKLNLDLAEIPAFAPIDEESLKYNSKLIMESDLIIVTDTPFGHGNIGNLYLLASLKRKKIILLNKKDIHERDYTNGKAIEYWKYIMEKNEIYLAKDEKEVLSLVEKL